MSFEARMSTEPIVGLTTNFQTPTSTFIGKIDTITVQCSSISSASTLTLAISEDVGGDVLQLTDTNSTIFSGKTTATDGAAMWKMDSIVYMNSNIAYVWLKTNTGSVTVDHIEITFEEI